MHNILEEQEKAVILKKDDGLFSTPKISYLDRAIILCYV